MEDNKNLKELRTKIESEIAAFVTKPSLNPSDVETAKNAVCLLKEIDEVLGMHGMMDETSEGRYPMRGYSHGWYPTHHDEYMDGYSMMRGRDAATGRYVSRDGDEHTSGRRYMFSYDTSGCYPSRRRSYDDGRSYHSIDDRIVDMLEKMMDDASSNYERNKLNTIIRVVDSMRGE